MSPLMVIIFDSITNSVFRGQLLQPICLFELPRRPVILLSYEQDPAAPQLQALAHELRSYGSQFGNFTLQLVRRVPLLDTLTTRFSVKHLRQITHQLTSYDILARGALAGALAIHDRHPSSTLITVQARGLIAQEYRYGKKRTFVTRARTLLLDYCERRSYRRAATRGTIEAVSPHLKEYLNTQWKIPLEKITIATRDKTPPIALQQRSVWRTITRNELQIDGTAIVYCYAGSLHPWQCPDKVVAIFKEQLQKDSTSMLLILTQQPEQYRCYTEQAGIPVPAVRILTVPEKEVCRYLAAADIGLLFREPDIVNWVSRPTKLLEYDAVGLEIWHNGTIGYITETADAHQCTLGAVKCTLEKNACNKRRKQIC